MEAGIKWPQPQSDFHPALHQSNSSHPLISPVWPFSLNCPYCTPRPTWHFSTYFNAPSCSILSSIPNDMHLLAFSLTLHSPFPTDYPTRKRIVSQTEDCTRTNNFFARQHRNTNGEKNLKIYYSFIKRDSLFSSVTRRSTKVCRPAATCPSSSVFVLTGRDHQFRGPRIMYLHLSSFFEM